VNPVKSYLTLSDAPLRVVGLRWSDVDAGLEFTDGAFVFGEQIAEFLEGFARVRRIVHFTFMVPFALDAENTRRTEATPADPARRRLRKLFQDTNGSLHNAGAFLRSIVP